MQPLADLLRPDSLDHYIGQSHLVGPGSPLLAAIHSKSLHSMILWGPPGCGKTTLARILANSLGAEFHYLSAVSAKKDDIRKIVESDLGVRPLSTNKVILFLDEIHRFNKAQQDYLLPYVESGALTLIGATTENPSFEVIGPLQSRCQVYVLKALTEADLGQLIELGAKRLGIKINPDAASFLATFANGDGRKVLNVLETASSLHSESPTLTLDILKNALQSPYLRYDQAGDEHYDTISAFIKSMRASQKDAAMYYLARMVEAGEDPIFIARRMVIFASEDVGLAVPTALVVANAVFRAVETIGYPECAISLAHGVAYLCECKKSRVSHDALRLAQEDIRTYGNLPIPLKVRNSPTVLMKNLGYGKDYQMRDKESFLPEKIKEKKYF